MNDKTSSIDVTLDTCIKNLLENAYTTENKAGNTIRAVPISVFTNLVNAYIKSKNYEILQVKP